MRKALFLLAFAFTFGVGNLFAGGGPDAYGYTWLDNNDAGGPTFNWIDLSTMAGAVQVTGLADDNSVGPYSMGWDFHYYWSDVSNVKVGSNGWLGFNNIGNISHCFPTVPTQGGAGDNFLAPFMSDLNFAGASNPGEVWYWTNNVDSFVISYLNAPWWVNATPDYAGDNSFQVILSGQDSSITFQYLSTTPGDFNDQTTCAADLEIGIENLTGNIGLEVLNETVPANNYVVKFYYPGTVTFQVPDATPAWAANSDNAGQFYFTNSNLDLQANVANVGNAAISSDITVSGSLESLAFINIWSDNTTITGGLAAGADQTVTFPTQVTTLTTAGQYYYTVNTSNGDDINPSNNETVVEISAVENVGSTLSLTYCTMNPPDGAIAWSGGGGNDGAGIYIVPPGYPASVTSVDLFILGDDGDPNTPMLAGYDVNLLEEDVNGMPGNVVATQTVSAANAIEDDWNNVPITHTFNSGGFYVSWIMEGDGVALGTEQLGPISRRTYEILSGSWAPYRQGFNEDFLIVVNMDSIFVSNDPAQPVVAEFNVYPNPANQRVTFAYLLSDNADVQVTLTNVFGQVVWSTDHVGRANALYNQSISTSEFAAGMYFVTLQTGKTKTTERLVISH